jgi:hypothetical protein
MEEIDRLQGLLRNATTRSFWAHFSPFMRLRGFVRRDDFLPEDVPPLLGNLVLLECRGAGFVYRLVGTNIAGRHGRDLTGCALDEWPDTIAATIAAQYRTVLAERRPILSHYTGPAYRSGRFDIVERRWEKLALPLSFAGDAPDGVLVCACESPETDDLPVCWAGREEAGCWCARPGMPEVQSR